MAWTSAYCAFAGEQFLKTGESVLVAFCAHFMSRDLRV